MNERFDKLIKVILKHEGGYVNDPDDLGGETNYGITKRRYPELDIKNMAIETAREIYLRDFYNKMNIYFIEDDLLALHVLDMGVNAGPKTAVELLQELLLDCVIDGILGPKTAAKIYQAQLTTNVVAAYKSKRIERYYTVSTYRNNKKFLKGWINRVVSTKL